MGKINFLSGRGFIVGIFTILLLFLLIPLIFVVSHHGEKELNAEAVPTAVQETLSFSNAQGNITGYVYNDTNQDGERERDEKPLKDMKMQLKILNENGTQSKIIEAKTDEVGYFKFRFYFNSSDHNSYMVKALLPKGFETVGANPVVITDVKPNVQKIIEFGLVNNNPPVTPSPTKKPVKNIPTPTTTAEITP